MIRARVDRLFVRYRQNGDARLLARVFDQTAPELWRVAAHLCRNRHDAEDAVQGTFLTAIESQQAWDAARPLLPWLVGMLVNRVRELRRQRERVLDATRMAVRDAADPAAAAGEREFGDAVAIALREVTEPFRSVVEGHLVRGLDAADIATELGVPAPTVRTRLHRGLEQLRRKLPTGAIAGAMVPLRMPAESLATTREFVLHRVPGGSAIAAGSGAALAGLLGVLTMKKVLLAVVAAGVAIGGWSVFDAPTEHGAGERAPVAIEVVAAEVKLALPTPQSESERVEVSEVVASKRTANAAPGSLSVLVRHATTHAPLVGVQVGAMIESPTKPAAISQGGISAPASSSRGDEATDRAQATTDAEGRVVLPIASGPVRVVVLAGRREPSFVTVQPGATTEYVHDVEPLFTADVLVHTRDGAPVADATIFAQDDLGRELKQVGRTGADGHWRDARVEPQLLVRASRPGLAASALAVVTSSSGTTRLELGPTAATMHGTVRDEAGAPVPGAIVVFAPEVPSPHSKAALTVRTNERGQYRCEWLVPGAYDLLVSHQVSAHDRRVATFHGQAVPNDAPASDLQFATGATVLVQLRLHDGTVLVGSHFELVRKIGEIPVGFAPWFHLIGRIDTGGVGALQNVMPGHYVLTASHHSTTVAKELALHAGETLRFEHTFAELCSLQIEVIDEQGTPRPDIGVQVRLRDDDNEQVRRLTDAHGRVQFDHIERRDYEVSLFRSEQRLPQSKHIVSSGSTVRLVMPNLVARSTVIGRVVQAGGDLPKSLSLSLRCDVANNPFLAESATVTLDAATGRFIAEDLPAGSYHFGAMTSEPFRNLALRPNIEVATGSVVDLGVIELGSGGLHIDVRSPSDTGKLRAGLGSGDGIYEVGPRQPETQTQIDLQQVAAGSYRVLVWGENVLPSFADAVVAIDAITSLTVDVAIGVRTEVLLPDSIGIMHVRWPDGSVLRETVLELKSWVRGLAPGNYHVEYVTFRGGRFTADFSVGTTSGPAIDLQAAPR